MEVLARMGDAAVLWSVGDTEAAELVELDDLYLMEIEMMRHDLDKRILAEARRIAG